MSSSVLCLGGDGGPQTVVIDESTRVEDIKKKLYPQELEENVYLCNGGIPLTDDHLLTCDSHLITLTIHYRILGGKGGFGSLIRATGSNRRKRNDKSACRDISGRRVRDIKNEKKVAEWMNGEADRRREKEEKKRRKLQKMLEEPRHKFTDTRYMEQVRAGEEAMGDSLRQGLEASGSGSCPPPAKRPKIWMGDDDLSGSDSDSDDGSLSPQPDYSDDGSPSPQPDCHYTVEHRSSTNEPLDTIPEEQENKPPSSIEQPSQPEPPPSIVDQPPSTVDQPPTSTSDTKEELPVSVGDYGSVEELSAAGGGRLKVSLMALGLKCGGTPLERATRLWATRGKSLDQLPASMFAKKRKK